MVIRAKYVVDDQGRRSAVVLDIEDYRQLLEYLEDLEDMVAFDRAVAEGGDAVPLEEAIREIEDGRLPR
jgi:hypothetical protein